MKKYNVGLASLLLFFATGAAIGMEENKNLTICLVNDCMYPLSVEFKYKDGTFKGFILNVERHVISRVNEIEQINMSTMGGPKHLTAGPVVTVPTNIERTAYYNKSILDEVNRLYKEYYSGKTIEADLVINGHSNYLSISEINWIDKRTKITDRNKFTRKYYD